jgi:hypothetical protein
MRNFDFNNDDANTSAANIAGIRPDVSVGPDLDSPIETLRLEEPVYEEQASLSAFHKSSDNDDGESSNSTAKIAGAVIVGLLLVGGSLYAYEAMTGKPQTVAMLPAAPQHNATAEQTVTPPIASSDASTAPSNSAPSVSAAPAMSTPKPARVHAGLADATPGSASTQTAAAAPAQDSVVNQPMTLTPENAPAPQQSAMQQPITAPNVTGAPAEPTPEVANNMAGATVQPDLTPSNVTPASVDSSTSPAVPSPAPAQ